MTVFRIYESSNPNLEPLSVSGTGNRAIEITRNSNIRQYTFTTSPTAQILLFQGSNGDVNEWFNRLMLNTGETPLPYEPYGWVHSLRKYNTSTDTLTTLPSNLYADGTNATVGLVGNMSQTGTPTPTTPIQPQETGERTAQLFDLTTAILGKYIDNQGIEQTSSSGITNHSDYIEIIPDIAYTVSVTKPSYNLITSALSWYDSSKNFLYRSYYALPAAAGTYSWNANSPNNAKYCILNFTTYPDFGNEKDMLNTGETPLPYEPYGYKIPILSASTTTNVYLGEVGTTRQIKKLVLDGTETGWTKSSTYQGSFFAQVLTNINIAANTEPVQYALCSHAQVVKLANFANGTATLTGNTTTKSINLWIGESEWTVDEFKSYLAQQYSNGTPVTIWYVLATETTGIVNEPLRKIGDYADTVSGITIPTITGKDTFDVLTTLKPSEVSLSYTGWHDAIVYEKSENLYDINAKDVNNGYVNDAQITQDGTIATWGSAEISEYIPISGDTAYTFNGIGSYNSPCYALYDESKQLIGAYRYNGAAIINFISPNNARYFRFTHIKTYTQAMMVEGTYSSSTMPEYEPYWT